MTAPMLVSKVRDPWERDVLTRLEPLLKQLGAKPGSITEVRFRWGSRTIQLSDYLPLVDDGVVALH